MHLSPILLSVPFRPLAYLDPGSGSIILQMAIAAFLGLGILARAQWSRIKKLFGRKKGDSDDSDSEE